MSELTNDRTASGKVLAMGGLVAFWDFQEPAGDRRSRVGDHVLEETAGAVAAAGEGIFGSRSASLGEAGLFNIARQRLGSLDIHGPAAQVSVVAWMKRRKSDYTGCQAVAGIWNEHGKRQYCLFLNLAIWNSSEQVGAHISGIGGATPGHPYCMDAAIGATPVSFDQWHCCAITYDGTFGRSYLDGRLDSRGDRNPYRYELGIFDGGRQGGDFTVGGVHRPEHVDENFVGHGSTLANRYHGLLGGLAIFNRALTDDEVAHLATLTEAGGA